MAKQQMIKGKKREAVTLTNFMLFLRGVGMLFLIGMSPISLRFGIPFVVA